jgi:plasmid stabilization system protein ParE
MYKIQISEEAELNLDNIFDYIAKDSTKIALQFTEKMLQKFSESVSENPKMCIKHKIFHLYIYRKNYYIFYKIIEERKEIIVAHVVRSSRYTAYKDFMM